MTIEVISDFISNVGFPIAVSGALFYQMMKTNEANARTFSEFKDIISANTNSIKQMHEIVKELKVITTELKYERKRMEVKNNEI